MWILFFGSIHWFPIRDGKVWSVTENILHNYSSVIDCTMYIFGFYSKNRLSEYLWDWYFQLFQSSKYKSSVRILHSNSSRCGKWLDKYSVLLSHAETESDRKKRLPLPTIDAQKVYVWYLEILIIYNNKSAFCLILYHRMQASTVYDFNNFAIKYNYITFLNKLNVANED